MKHEEMVFQLKITLQDSKPPIWRCVLVSSEMPLSLLHEVIQCAMGWKDCHFHVFETQSGEYAVPSPYSPSQSEGQDASKVLLKDIFHGEKDKIHYVYDFGDNWNHAVVLEKVLSPETVTDPLPICTVAKNVCPPEDCGGIFGYYSLLETIQDTNHPDYEELSEWLDEDFDPAQEVDVETINRKLKALQVKGGRREKVLNR